MGGRYSKAATRIENQYRVWGGGSDKHKCVFCGDDFRASPTAKYCSQRCTNDAAIAARKAKANLKRTKAKACICCSQPIEQSPASKVKLYCSPACKQRTYRAKAALSLMTKPAK